MLSHLCELSRAYRGRAPFLNEQTGALRTGEPRRRAAGATDFPLCRGRTRSVTGVRFPGPAKAGFGRLTWRGVIGSPHRGRGKDSALEPRPWVRPCGSGKAWGRMRRIPKLPVAPGVWNRAKGIIGS